jgi:Rrf2 family iron-sulfur cluster assembly transcriptional regulator
MNLSTKGRYAVMAMTDLAGRDQSAAVTLAAIAERQAIPLSYLVQLFNKLKKAGLVISTRGPGGGYRLAAPASRICVSDIMLAVEEPFRTTRCPGVAGHGCLRGARCLTHDLWDALGAHIAAFLSTVTLADVIDGSPHSFVAPGPGCRSILGARAAIGEFAQVRA